MADETLTTDGPDAPETEPEAPEPAVDTARVAVVEALRAQFGDAIVGDYVARGDVWVRVAPASWAPVVRFCKDVLGFRFFDFLSGLDWLNNPDLSAEKVWDADAQPTVPDPRILDRGYAGGDTRFQVLCRLINIDTHVGVTLKVDLDEENPHVESIVAVFAGADWHERETWEMFGFIFDGHPALRHLYLPGAFEGFPLRKDFPLLAREIRPWPGLVDKEPMPGENVPDAAAEGSLPDGADAALPKDEEAT